jgi:hypothetical protein
MILFAPASSPADCPPPFFHQRRCPYPGWQCTHRAPPTGASAARGAATGANRSAGSSRRWRYVPTGAPPSMGPRAAPPAVPAPVPLGACSGGSRQATATKGGDEQGAAGRGNDGDKERKRAEETTAAKGGEKNGDGKGRRRGEETTTAKGGEKNHAQRGRLFLGLVWQGTGGRVKTATAGAATTGRAKWHVLPPCRRNCPAPCANHGANAPTHHNTLTPSRVAQSTGTRHTAAACGLAHRDPKACAFPNGARCTIFQYMI